MGLTIAHHIPKTCSAYAIVLTGLDRGAAFAASTVDFENRMIGCKACPLGKSGDAVRKLDIDMLCYDATVIADCENRDIVIMRTATDCPRVERFNSMHSTRVEQFFKCPVYRGGRCHTIWAKPFQDVIRRKRAVLLRQIAQNPVCMRDAFYLFSQYTCSRAQIA